MQVLCLASVVQNKRGLQLLLEKESKVSSTPNTWMVCYGSTRRKVHDTAAFWRNCLIYAIWHLWLLDLLFRSKSYIHWKQCMHPGCWSVRVVVGGHPISVGEPEWVSDGLGAIMVTVPLVVGVRPVLDLQCRMPKARLSERRVVRLRLGEAAFIHLHSLVTGKQISATFFG